MMPRLQLLVLIALAGIPLIVGVRFPLWRELGVLLTITVFAVSLTDLIISPPLAQIELTREAPEILSVGAKNAVKIRLKNPSSAPYQVQVHDEPPQPCDFEKLPLNLKLPPQRTRSFVYHVQPHRRGKNRFGRVYLRSRSRLRLWTLQEERRLNRPVRIYPDIQAIHGVELLGRQNRLAQAGVKLSRLRGRGNDFDRLREYRREDEYRSIDWKATARHEKLISREYVVERNQNLLFLLDCGRSMCNQQGGISHFDRSLNAAIKLAYVALRQGDSVGFLACSDKVERWIPPVRTPGSIEKVISRIYDLEPNYNASDYDLMVEELRRRYRKRSLVVLITHALDEVHLNTISRSVRELRRPHLALGAFLRNVPLHERLNGIPSTDREAFQIAAAAEMVAGQSLQIANLQKSGLLVVETLPEELSAQLVSRYLDIKARHLL